MVTSVAKALLIITAVVTLGCNTNGRALFDGIVPASATSVQYINQSGVNIGVKFHLVSSPHSYQYIDAVRKKLRASGYRLCDKSAITKWAPRPADPRDVAAPAFWINELYATKGYGKFFLIRVDSVPAVNGLTWNQRFILGEQIIHDGKQNMANIQEFCD